MDILDKIISYKKKEVEKLKSQNSVSLNNQYRDYKDRLNIFTVGMKKPGISVIAEVKRKSPSAGNLRKEFNPVKIAK
jgi:indole-3-glycerol phosphate synthase